MIELKNINKSYGDLHVLKDISLTISKKELDWAINKIKSIFDEVEKKVA